MYNQGQKEIDLIHKWLKKQCGTGSIIINTEDELDKFIKENEVTVLGILKVIEIFVFKR